MVHNVRNRTVLATAVVAACTFAQSSVAGACVLPPATEAERYAAADVVALVHVESVDTDDGTAEVRVLQRAKGSIDDDTELRTGFGEGLVTSCDASMQSNRRYVVFAHRDDDTLRVGSGGYLQVATGVPVPRYRGTPSPKPRRNGQVTYAAAGPAFVSWGVPSSLRLATIVRRGSRVSSVYSNCGMSAPRAGCKRVVISRAAACRSTRRIRITQRFRSGRAVGGRRGKAMVVASGNSIITVSGSGPLRRIARQLRPASGVALSAPGRCALKRI